MLKVAKKEDAAEEKKEDIFKVLAPFRKEFIRHASANKTSNAYLATLSKHGKGFTLDEQGSGPCHGAWQADRERLRSPFYAFSAVQQIKRCPEIEKDFYTFLANESVFKDCFLSKDYADILENGWVFDTSQPANVVGNAAIATRFYTESYSPSLKARHPIYLALREMGLTVWESYFFAHVFTPESTSKPFPCSAVPYRNGHTIFLLTNRSIETFGRMLKAEFVPDQVSKQSFKELSGYTYGTLDSIWGPVNATPKPFFETFKPKVATSKVNLNIFEKKLASGFSLKNEKDLMNVVEQIKEALL